MKTIALIAFEQFTDIDLFLMWDILGRQRQHWQVRILGSQPELRSANGLALRPHGRLDEANHADAVLFASGKQGVPAALAEAAFLGSFRLDPRRQLIGSICAGSFFLARLGLLPHNRATTHPDARAALSAMGVTSDERPFVCDGNVATAGGCLSALYLVAWIAERLLGSGRHREVLRELLPAGQEALFGRLVEASLVEGGA